MASWIAAATSYSTNNRIMIPFYVYYSMFGFQRIGDLAWAAGDMQARFPAGRHFGPYHAQRRRPAARRRPQPHPGEHHPQLRELRPDLRPRSRGDHARRFEAHGGAPGKRLHYITLLNENYAMPGLPPGTEEQIIKGMYLCKPGADGDKRVQLLGSGTILRESLEAQTLLAADWGVQADVWSCPEASTN